MTIYKLTAGTWNVIYRPYQDSIYVDCSATCCFCGLTSSSSSGSSGKSSSISGSSGSSGKSSGVSSVSSGISSSGKSSGISGSSGSSGKSSGVSSVSGISSAVGTIKVACCPNNIPTVLFMTITNVSGCACMAGTYQMNWNGTNWVSSSFTVCSVTNSTVGCNCVSGPNQFFCSANGINFGNVAMTTNSCSPLNLSASGVIVTFGCSGTINITVTQ